MELHKAAEDVPLLWVESGVPSFPDPAHLAEVPSAAYLIDTHRSLWWRRELANAFDHVWVAQKPAVGAFRARGIVAEWLPLAAQRELTEAGAPLSDRAHDVAFVGQAPPGSLRAAVLAALAPKVSLAPRPHFVEPSQMMDLYRSARVVVNIPVGSDLNMRVFEAAAARCVLVTTPVQGLEEVLPTCGYAAVRGVVVDGWCQAVLRALAAPDAQQMADVAFERIRDHHTYDNRVDTVMEWLVDPPRASIPTRVRRRAIATAWMHAGLTDEVRAAGGTRPQRLGAYGYRAARRSRHALRDIHFRRA